MKARGKPARPTETEETYIPLFMHDSLWMEVCENIKLVSGVDNNHFQDQLKNNTELKGLIIKLAIYRAHEIMESRTFFLTDALFSAFDDICRTLQSKYRSKLAGKNSRRKTHEQMDQDAKMYLQSELQEGAVTPHTRGCE